MIACAPVEPPLLPMQGLQTVEGDWLLTFPDLGRPQQTLTIAAGAVSGSSGCNNFQGTLDRSGGANLFAQLAATEMACEPAVMQNEALFFEAMAAARRLSRSGDTLNVTDAAGETVLQFARVGAAAPSIEGIEWMMAGGAWNANAPSLRIDEARASGSTGCNRWFGEVTRDGDALRISNVGQTKMACLGPEGAAEMTFLTALSRTARYTLEGRILVLRDANGGEVARFSAQR